MKKLITLALAAIMLLSFALPASADVIYEPGNSFYEEHRDDCRYENRYFTVNTDKGYAYLFVDPETDAALRSYSNGEKIYISHIYTDADGNEWGVTEAAYEDSGWFKMTDLTVIYDSVEFKKEHGSEFKDYIEGSYAITPSEDDQVVMWNYPGGEAWDTSYGIEDSSFMAGITKTYTDKNGNVWGNVSYYYGHRDFWVCLTEPYSNDVGGFSVEENKVQLKADPVENVDIPKYIGEDDKNGDGVVDSDLTLYIVIGVLIAAVVALTAALIAVIFKKNKAGSAT